MPGLESFWPPLCVCFGAVEKTWALESDFRGSSPGHVLTVWHWAGCFTSGTLSFLSIKVGDRSALPSSRSVVRSKSGHAGRCESTLQLCKSSNVTNSNCTTTCNPPASTPSQTTETVWDSGLRLISTPAQKGAGLGDSSHKPWCEGTRKASTDALECANGNLL